MCQRARAAHRAGGCAKGAATGRLRRSKENIGYCRRAVQSILPDPDASNSGGAARFSRDAPQRHGGCDEDHSPEACGLLRLAERRAEGEVQHHWSPAAECFLATLPSEQWRVGFWV